LLLSSIAYASPDDARVDLYYSGEAIQQAPADTDISRALRDISAEKIHDLIEKLVSFKNRNALSSMGTDLPSGTGIKAAAEWIESQFQQTSAACNNCLSVQRDTFLEQPQSGPSSRIPKPTEITNVYAILRGADPVQAKRMYLITANYDSRNTDALDSHGAAPGANDDASGVAAVLECARVLSKLKLPATLVFVAVAGEEQGLNGASHLAKLAKTEGWQLEGVLNNDIIGGNTTPGDTLQDKNRVRVFSEGIPATATPEQLRMIQNLGGENDSPSRELARSMTDAAQTYFPAKAGTDMTFRPVLEFRRDRFLRGGDHTAFNHEGFPAVRLTEWREDFNHQHQNLRTENGIEFGDLVKFVDFQYVANVARLNAATLASLASAPPPPRELKIVTRNLDNNTELKWEIGPSGTHYEVVWRETDAPDWQRFLHAEEPHALLRVSKDNVIFGVRSVDAAGHRSLVVVPVPER
jgi:Peptidase family M28